MLAHTMAGLFAEADHDNTLHLIDRQAAFAPAFMDILGLGDIPYGGYCRYDLSWDPVPVHTVW